MQVIANTIVCSDCGITLRDAVRSDDPMCREPCPDCGSTNRTFHEFVVESISLRDGVAMKAKRPGEKRPPIETKSLPQHCRSRDKLVHRVQVIDRENDRYFERVTDYESGEVIHECEERLSEHLGHGADKKNRKNSGPQ
jgi:hypothetical protein